jgi:oligopeptide/dipeptide ABC transporter ATP-binding protein
MTQPQALLAVEGLEKRFQLGGGLLGIGPVVKAVDGVDLELYAGESLAIVGESGSGKTTLARCLAGLTRPTSGRVIFADADIWRLRGAAWRNFRRQVQPVFQDPYSSLDPRWSAARTIREALDAFDIDDPPARKSRVAELMQQVGLPPYLGARRPHELSGGQCQRVGIAAALALSPSVLVADEPVSALDVSVRAQILNLLARLRHELQLSLVLITHDLSVVEHLSDRTAVMYLGRIVEVGPTRDLLAAPSHPYTQAVVRAIPRPDPTRRFATERLRGDVPSALAIPSGCRFHTRCPVAIAECSTLEPLLKKHGNRLVACHLV